MIKVPKYLRLIALLTPIAGTTSAVITPAPAQAQVVEFKQVIGIGQNDSLNMRTGPGNSFADIGDVRNGAIVKVWGYDSTGRWAKLHRTGRDVWVSAKYLADVETNPDVSIQPNANRLGAHLVTGIPADDPDGGLNMRFKPNRYGRVKATLPLGTPVDVVRLSADGKWSFIRGPFGKGWVRNTHLVKALPRKTPAPQPPPTELSQDPQGNSLPAVFTVIGVAKGDRLWVRTKPNATSAPVNNLAPSGPVLVLAWLNNGWAKVSIGQNIGYVNGVFLQHGGGQKMQNGFPLGLTCAGTEPFWALDLNGDQTVSFRPADRPNPLVIGLQMTAPANSPDGYPFSFRAGRLSGHLDQASCSDGMSDIEYGWSLTLIRNAPNGPTTTAYGCCRLR